MALSDIQDEIKLRVKKTCISEELHDALAATTEENLIEAGMTIIDYLYQSGVVDDELLTEFTQAKLNARGIYSVNTTITNFSNEIFVLSDAICTISLDNTDKATVNVLGNATANITLADSSFIEINAQDKSKININISENSTAIIKCRAKSNIVITSDDESMYKVEARGYSVIEATMNDNSCGLVTLEQNASIVYQLNDDSEIEIKNTNKNNVVILEPEIDV